MPRLSILIPYLGNRDFFENTLASVLQNRPAGAEVIVALGCDYDDPYHIDEEVRFARVEARGGLSELVNSGFRACLAPVVHVLACGVTVSEGWVEPALAHFCDRRVASVAPLIVDAAEPSRIWAAGLQYHPGGARLRRGQGQPADRLDGIASNIIGPSWVAGFYRRALAGAAHGPFDPTLGAGTADIDLALRLSQAGYATVFEPRSLIQQPAAAEPQSGGLAAAREGERLFWRHSAVHGSWQSVAPHGLLIAGEFIRALPRPRAVSQLIGRVLGCCEWGNRRRQQLLLQLPLAADDAAFESPGYRLDRPHGDRSVRQGDSAPVRGRTNPPLNDRRP